MQACPLSDSRTISSCQKEQLYPLTVTSHPPLHLGSWQWLIYLLSLRIWLFWTVPTDRITVPTILLLAPFTCIMFSRFIHVIAGVSTSFFITKKIPLYGYTTFCFSTHLWAFELFRFLSIMNNAAMNMHAHQSFLFDQCAKIFLNE